MRAPDNSPRLHVFHMRIRESSGLFPEVIHCAGGSRSFASRPSAVGTAAGGRFRAPHDQLAQLERGRTESPARIIICVANYFFRRKNARAFFSGSRAVGPCRAPASKRWSRGARNPRAELSFLSQANGNRAVGSEEFQIQARLCGIDSRRIVL